VEKLSDVVEGMNLSYCSSIKKGTVEVSGSTTTINENSFKSSDLNAVISVKVTNQTITSDSNAEFLPIEGINAGSATFNQTYGDSYISGFVNGGEFTGIVSIKVIDRSKVAKTVNEIKSALAKAKQREEVVFSPVDSMSLSGLSSCMTGVESTISVAWMGGGQIKARQCLQAFETTQRLTFPQLRQHGIWSPYWPQQLPSHQRLQSAHSVLGQFSQSTRQIATLWRRHVLLLLKYWNMIRSIAIPQSCSITTWYVKPRCRTLYRYSKTDLVAGLQASPQTSAGNHQ
jgi:hypothetical protein